MPVNSNSDRFIPPASMDDSKQIRKSHVRIRENAFFAKLAGFYLKEDHVAITIGNRIYLHHSSAGSFLANKSWVAHELAHVRQFATYGLIRFLWMYLWESCLKGYYNNKWEVAARQQETDLTILEEFTFV